MVTPQQPPLSPSSLRSLPSSLPQLPPFPSFFTLSFPPYLHVSSSLCPSSSLLFHPREHHKITAMTALSLSQLKKGDDCPLLSPLLSPLLLPSPLLPSLSPDPARKEKKSEREEKQRGETEPERKRSTNWRKRNELRQKGTQPERKRKANRRKRNELRRKGTQPKRKRKADPNLCCKDLKAGRGSNGAQGRGWFTTFLVPILFLPLPCRLCQLCTAI